METLEYTPSVFADEVGVIRSSISHIMSGRNKPGVELLQKVLKRFPEVSAEWLLAGLGPMFRDGQRPNVNSVPKREPVKETPKAAEQTTLLGYLESIQQPDAQHGSAASPQSKPAAEPAQAIPSAQAGARSAEIPSNGVANQKEYARAEIQQAPVEEAHIQPSVQPQQQGVSIELPKPKDKAISKIVVYFNDKTYQEFRASED